MKFALVSLFAAANAMGVKRSASPLVLDFDVERGNGTNAPVQKRLESATLYDLYEVRYLTNLYLGLTSAHIRAIIDTGSLDLWTYGLSAQDHTGPLYNPYGLSTVKETNIKFDIGYDDGTGSVGLMYIDLLGFSPNSNVLTDFEFANVNQTSGGGYPILGIADKNQEAAYKRYDNLPWALANHGLTPRASYSLYLNQEGDNGNIIFGGIDTAKIDGHLTYFAKGKENSIAISSIAAGGQTFSLNNQALLDLGTSMTLLPQNIVDYLDTIFNPDVEPSGWTQDRFVLCTQPTDKYIDFTFGSLTMSVSYLDFTVREDDGLCRIGYAPSTSTDTGPILGDSFLRSAYVYYDLTDKRIGLGPVKYTDDSNVVAA